MRILNFGSLNLDFVYQVEHFVRPGETILSDRLDIFNGGKGLNQSIALARAGATVFHAGRVGSDGQRLVDCLADNGVDTRFIRRSAGPGGHALIQVDASGQNCIILHGGSNQQIAETDIDETLDFFAAGDILLLQNEINHVALIMEKAHQRGLNIALNPSPITASLSDYPLKYVSWFILNEIEAAALTGNSGQADSRTGEQMAGRLIERWPQAAVVLTLGSEGAIYLDRNHVVRQPARRVPVVDTTAAGDTFTGYFLQGIAAGQPIHEVMLKASAAAAICVSRPGASDSIPWRREVEG
ncbi:MAG TPA: ribokinase [Clostridiales bacterium]|nr:ribokinase [Clostridiales bacterium]